MSLFAARLATRKRRNFPGFCGRCAIFYHPRRGETSPALRALSHTKLNTPLLSIYLCSMIEAMKLFVWDFHGTLEQGNELAALEISNAALAKLGFKERFTEEQAVTLYGKKWYEYFEFLLPEEPHETHMRLQEMSFAWPTHDEVIAKYIRPNDYVDEVLGAIRTKGHDQIVISNTNKTALPIFLRLTGLDKHFNDQRAMAVMAHTREVKRSKVDVVQDYLATLDARPELIVIGDSAKDMQLAEDLGAKGYWYRHPHHPVPEIVKQDPNIVTINDLRGVLAELA